MNLSIRVRMALWYALVLATMIALLGSYLVVQLRADLRQAIDEDVRVASATITRTFIEDLQDQDGDEVISQHTEQLEEFLDAAAASVPPTDGAQLLDARGEVLTGFGVAAGAAPLVARSVQAAARSGGDDVFQARLGDANQRFRISATSVRFDDEDMVLVVALSLHRAEEAVGRLLLLLLLAGPAVLAATTPAAYWLARKALRPVERMTSDAQQIGAGQLHDRVAVPASDDEVRSLAVTLNAMLARIEQGVMNKHRLIADASHELRTPLAVMRAELDVSLRGDDLPPVAREVLESAREEVDRVSRAVDNLLALAAVEEGKLQLLTITLDLREAVEQAARPLRLLAVAKEVTLFVDGDPCEVQADSQRLHLAITNLIENAIKFTDPGGSVRVRSWRSDGQAGVTVSDEGPGISDEDRKHLFDRFYRADGDPSHPRAGSGLGLAICQEIALAHGGSTRVDDGAKGGSTFTFALPGWRVQAVADDRATPESADSRGSLPVDRVGL